MIRTKTRNMTISKKNFDFLYNFNEIVKMAKEYYLNTSNSNERNPLVILSNLQEITFQHLNKIPESTDKRKLLEDNHVLQVCKRSLDSFPKEYEVSNQIKKEIVNSENQSRDDVRVIKTTPEVSKDTAILKQVELVMKEWKTCNHSFFHPTGVKMINKILSSKMTNEQKMAGIKSELQKCRTRSSDTRHPITQEAYAIINTIINNSDVKEDEIKKRMRGDPIKLQKLRLELDKLPNNFCHEIDEIKKIISNRNSSFSEMVTQINGKFNSNWQLEDSVAKYPIFVDKKGNDIANAIKLGTQDFLGNLLIQQSATPRSLKELIEEKSTEKFLHENKTTDTLDAILENVKKHETIQRDLPVNRNKSP